MAVSTILIQLQWENEGTFVMTRKKDEGDAKVIVQAEEQGSLAAIWVHLEAACKECFNGDLSNIGSEMKA